MTVARHGGAQRRRSPFRLAAGAALVAGSLAPALVGLPRATADTTFTTNPVQVTITRLTPIAPQPGDTLVVAGTLRNTSTTATATDLHYELKLGNGQINSRDEFDAYADDQDGDITSLRAIPPLLQGSPPTLAPGASEPYRIRVPVDSLQLDPNVPQVRDLGVSVTSNITPVGHVRTFLPWEPRGSTSDGTPIGLAWIWPLADRPHRTTATSWYDDDLAGELGAGGRLGALVNAASVAEAQHSVRKHPKRPTVPVPVTWAIDPMLVDDAAAMSAGYRFTDSSGTHTGTGQNAAKSWLTALRSAVTRPGASVLPFAYGDPDVVAAVRNGFATTIGLATAAGHAVIERLLPGAPVLSSYAWPPGGLVDERTINDMVASGDQTLVLSSAAVPPSISQSATPPARTTLTTTGGPVDALLTDFGLNTVVSDGVTNPDGTRIALQRFLAETLMIHEEAPFPQQERDFVVSPNRRWQPSPDYAAALLADSGKVPWIHPMTLPAVDAAAPDTEVTRQLEYPDSARHTELSPAYLRLVSDLRSDIANFAAVLPQGSSEIRGLTTDSWRTLSSAWRSQRGLAATELTAMIDQVTAEKNQVRITSKAGSFVTLTSHGGKVPITISNDLDTPANVVLKLSANQRLTENARKSVALPAHQQTVVDVHADAKTSGVFPLSVQLLTPNGKKYAPPVTLYVRSTAYGTITLVITGAATAALLVAVAIRLVRRARSARRAATAG